MFHSYYLRVWGFWWAVLGALGVESISKKNFYQSLTWVTKTFTHTTQHFTMAPEKKRKRSQDGGESIPAKKPHMKKSGDPSKPKSAQKPSSLVEAAPTTSVAPSTLRAVRNEEESFPRGGASALTPLEFKQISNEAARDVLFEAGGGTTGVGDGDAALKKGKRRPKRRHEEKKGKNTVKEEDKKDKGPKPEGLSFKASFCLWCHLGWSTNFYIFICRIWYRGCWCLDAFPG